MGAHLKQVIATLRTAFPDLHFEVHEMLCEGDVVACRSTMTGTHQGPLNIGPMGGLPISTCTSSATTTTVASPTSGTSGTPLRSHGRSERRPPDLRVSAPA
jgi:SnoaL-like polyketide cyclase